METFDKGTLCNAAWLKSALLQTLGTKSALQVIYLFLFLLIYSHSILFVCLFLLYKKGAMNCFYSDISASSVVLVPIERSIFPFVFLTLSCRVSMIMETYGQ